MTRSVKKGPFVDPVLLKKIGENKKSGQKKNIKTWSRDSVVIPEFVGTTINIHDGRKFISVFITENMVGHALGEFAPTRTFRIHSGQRKAGMEGEDSSPKTSASKSAAPKAAATTTPATK